MGLYFGFVPMVSECGGRGGGGMGMMDHDYGLQNFMDGELCFGLYKLYKICIALKKWIA